MRRKKERKDDKTGFFIDWFHDSHKYFCQVLGSIILSAQFCSFNILLLGHTMLLDKMFESTRTNNSDIHTV